LGAWTALGEWRGEYRVLVGKPKDEKLGKLRIIIKWKFRNWDMRAGTELIWLRIGTGGGLL